MSSASAGIQHSSEETHALEYWFFANTAKTRRGGSDRARANEWNTICNCMNLEFRQDESSIPACSACRSSSSSEAYSEALSRCKK